MTSASMESQIKSLNPNEEELLVNYRLSHPTTDVRSLTKGIAGRVAHLIPSAQQEELAKSTAERRDDLKLEMTKHVWTLRRSQRAVEVQQRESLSLDRRTEEMVTRIARERSALIVDESHLADARRRSERFRRCEELVETLSKKRQTQVQLDELITRLHSDIAEQQSCREAFIHEARTRKEKFKDVAEMLKMIREIPKTDPERSVEGAKVESTAQIAAPPRPVLDPAAPVFKPSEDTNSARASPAPGQHASAAHNLPRNPSLPARPTAVGGGRTSSMALPPAVTNTRAPLSRAPSTQGGMGLPANPRNARATRSNHASPAASPAPHRTAALREDGSGAAAVGAGEAEDGEVTDRATPPMRSKRTRDGDDDDIGKRRRTAGR